MSVTISEAVKYIGVDDKTIDLFESQYVVPHGVSYNSYLILDEKVALMDTVDARGVEQWEKNLLAALDGRNVDYLIVSHLEPDHAGSIGRLVELFPEVTLVGNAKTFQMLPQFFDELPVDENHKITVAEGESLSLGTHTLNFYMAPMVHWPEVMVTYESSEKILFSADGFGKFGALDYEDPEGWACEARRYYFNIVGKYGAPVQALLKKAAGLDIQTICPLHGPVLNENLGYYIGLYDTWSSYKPENQGVLVAYASIHGNTAKAAQKFAEMLRAKGVEKVSVMDLSRDDMAEVVEDAFRYDRMVLAAASYDGGVFPCMQDFLHHLQSKAYQKRTVGIIENGTWGPTAGRTMKGILETMKDITIVDPMVTIRSTMKESDLPAMEALADVIANA
ncbi:MAG: FprA family A-type flavoprotein [Agathobacter sp.]|nr:FprA family A-type flavoprotein [Agathobacter sp.]MDY6312600.1 FprA family A-type flavoprotein [Lachnospiraceae bacterium]MDY6355534.1 FprA family A-type flavoprotein [Lachnospiraceae bacterium]MDY6359666.1 FprA family A-type flavoprotein [Lachnospiraceae bacterium]